jgi:glycolate oxidase iron-sulfur subunit
MRHEIRLEELPPQGADMVAAIGACVHCGFCLAACPTYLTLGEEMDSPRGRILLMKEVLEGGLELESAAPHLDRCLGCLACVSACPSGVHYGDLITPFRAWAEERRTRPALERLHRALLLRTLPHPQLLRLGARLGRLGAPFARLLPARMQAMVQLAPARLPSRLRLPERVCANGPRRARVALLAGCAQQVLAPEINAATLRVLANNGVETVIPPGQGCCGALAMHAGAANLARPLARATMRGFPRDVDAILTNAAGCGSAMHEYGMLLDDATEREEAQRFAERVLDVSVFLERLGLSPPPAPLERPTRVVYQDACHLAHAQGVRAAPRALLSAVGNLELCEPAEADLCCGSAGTYNLEMPKTAAELGRRKAANLRDCGAEVVASGNIGCIVQIDHHLRALGAELPVMHTMQVLDRAYARRPLRSF